MKWRKQQSRRKKELEGGLRVPRGTFVIFFCLILQGRIEILDSPGVDELPFYVTTSGGPQAVVTDAHCR